MFYNTNHTHHTIQGGKYYFKIINSVIRLKLQKLKTQNCYSKVKTYQMEFQKLTILKGLQKLSDKCDHCNTVEVNNKHSTHIFMALKTFLETLEHGVKFPNSFSSGSKGLFLNLVWYTPFLWGGLKKKMHPKKGIEDYGPLLFV